MDDAAPLVVEGLAIRYGAIRAVHAVSLEVRRREIVTLVGSNGAGKSSTLNAIAGLVRPAGGQIRVDGARVDGLRPWQLVGRGVSLTPEGRQVFPRFTVEENLLVGAYARRERRAVPVDLDRVFALFPVLRERRRQLAGTLSGGEQQMLTIARALMARPRLLLLDEPSLGLAPLVARQIFETVAEIRRQGVAVLLVEQNVHLAFTIADRAYVMETGRVRLTGTPAELARDEAVVRTYLGG
ncbi:MAG TPA: ABC transporter ATP-binding protein [Methylomirabilota bacterium]|jgi:branched-chain amino acid transport system ATP-binding protein|nr:ABC transporter ATP-binding protein [Methylomirabilota bacterium]